LCLRAPDKLCEDFGGFGFLEQDSGTSVRNRFQFPILFSIEYVSSFGGTVVERGEKPAQLDICSCVVLKVSRGLCSARRL
jgi:hypothetical protein